MDLITQQIAMLKKPDISYCDVQQAINTSHSEHVNIEEEQSILDQHELDVKTVETQFLGLIDIQKAYHKALILQ